MATLPGARISSQIINTPVLLITIAIISTQLLHFSTVAQVTGPYQLHTHTHVLVILGIICWIAELIAENHMPDLIHEIYIAPRFPEYRLWIARRDKLYRPIDPDPVEI